jgi:CheY-like chemotaxis protein
MVEEFMKILLVDDNSDITTMLSKYFTMKGHICNVSNDGQNGLAMIENQKFDVVLLDLAMPDFSGRDIVNALSKNGKIKTINIVTLTASSISPDDDANLKAKGVHSLLKKPIDPDYLLDYLKQFDGV